MPEPAPSAATKFGEGAAVALEVVVAMLFYQSIVKSALSSGT